MSHASKGREGKYAKAQKGVYKVTNIWMQPTRQWNINVQAMSTGPIANSEHPGTGDLFSQLMDLTSSKKLVAAVAEKPLEFPDSFYTKAKLQIDRTGLQIPQEHSNLRLIESRCSSERWSMWWVLGFVVAGNHRCQNMIHSFNPCIHAFFDGHFKLTSNGRAAATASSRQDCHPAKDKKKFKSLPCWGHRLLHKCLW